PSRPTCLPMRASSRVDLAFISTRSLKAAPIWPINEVRRAGRRTEKLPLRTASRASSSSWRAVSSAPPTRPALLPLDAGTRARPLVCLPPDAAVDLAAALVRAISLPSLRCRGGRMFTKPCTSDTMYAMPTPRFRVVVADDGEDMRELIVAALELSGSFVVVGRAADGADAIVEVGRHQPDLAVIDLAMPVVSGLEAIPGIRAASPETKVVVVSGFP